MTSRIEETEEPSPGHLDGLGNVSRREWPRLWAIWPPDDQGKWGCGHHVFGSKRDDGEPCLKYVKVDHRLEE